MEEEPEVELDPIDIKEFEDDLSKMYGDFYHGEDLELNNCSLRREIKKVEKKDNVSRNP